MSNENESKSRTFVLFFQSFASAVRSGNMLFVLFLCFAAICNGLFTDKKATEGSGNVQLLELFCRIECFWRVFPIDSSSLVVGRTTTARECGQNSFFQLFGPGTQKRIVGKDQCALGGQLIKRGCLGSRHQDRWEPTNKHLLLLSLLSVQQRAFSSTFPILKSSCCGN